MDRLNALGWDDVRSSFFEQYRQQGLQPARVLAQHRGAYVLGAAGDDVWAEPTGRMRHEADPTDLPVTGDWVAFVAPPGGGRAVIQAVLPRVSAVTRKDPGRNTRGQVLAANMDLVLVTAAADVRRNDHRIFRYLAAAWESGAEPVVVLTKCDLTPAPDIDEVTEAARGVDVLRTSTVSGEGIDVLRSRLTPNRTAVLLGPSGTGKSSLVNALCGTDVQEVSEIRAADSRGRHTTTAREIVTLEGGGILIDTPGLRELALWDAKGLTAYNDDIEELMQRCRFRDCAHTTEPGCAILRALEDGTLDPQRWERHLKLEREVAWLEGRKEDLAAMKSRSKTISRFARAQRKLR